MGGIDAYCSNCDKYSLVKDHWVCDLCRKYCCEDCVENLDQCIICKNIFCNQCGMIRFVMIILK